MRFCGRSGKRFLRNGLLTAVGIAVLAVIYWKIGCPIRWLTGIACPGCGMSRALLALCRGEWRQALQYHPLVGTVPFLAVWLLLGLRKKRLPRPWENGLILGVSLLFLTVYGWRWYCGDPVVLPRFSQSFLQTILREVFLL